jgi:hypothetical protein
MGNTIRTDVVDYIESEHTVIVGAYERSLPSNSSFEQEPYYKAFSRCCSPNEAHKLDGGCILWCEIPSKYLRDDSVETLDEFTEQCFNDARREEGVEGSSIQLIDERGDQDEGAGMAVRPNLMGMLLLLLLVSLLAGLGPI